jgi:FAD/FMN-containing dehydrogenase
MTSEQLCARLAEVVGAAHLLTDPADTLPHATDWRKRWFGKALASVKPATTEEVAAS